MTLDELAIKHKTDKSSKHHNYAVIYEKYFEPLRNKPITLLELGYGGYEYHDRGGQGARMWLEYFPNMKMGCVDLYDKDSYPATGRFLFCKGSQDDDVLLKTFVAMLGTPDIIIDDASHVCDLTIKSFEILFPLLKPGGIYVIEDIEGSFVNGWSKGTLDFNDFQFPTPLNLARKLANDVNAQYIPNYHRGYSIESIHFHKNLIIIQKL